MLTAVPKGTWIDYDTILSYRVYHLTRATRSGQAVKR